ncbi:MAG: metallophosphoesterase family protein [Ktedonobacterales bacterium]
MVCGHTHIQFELRQGDLRILNAGSVGMPFADRPGAYWLLLTTQGYEFRRTAYNREAAANEIRASGNPHAREFAEQNVLTTPTEAAMLDILEQWSRENESLYTSQATQRMRHTLPQTSVALSTLHLHLGRDRQRPEKGSALCVSRSFLIYTAIATRLTGCSGAYASKA